MDREKIQGMINGYRQQEQQFLAMANRAAGAVIALQELLAQLPDGVAPTEDAARGEG